MWCILIFYFSSVDFFSFSNMFHFLFALDFFIIKYMLIIKRDSFKIKSLHLSQFRRLFLQTEASLWWPIRRRSWRTTISNRFRPRTSSGCSSAHFRAEIELEKPSKRILMQLAMTTFSSSRITKTKIKNIYVFQIELLFTSEMFDKDWNWEGDKSSFNDVLYQEICLRLKKLNVDVLVLVFFRCR